MTRAAADKIALRRSSLRGLAMTSSYKRVSTQSKFVPAGRKRVLCAVDVPHGADHDVASAAGGREGIVEADGERVAEMVGGELELAPHGRVLLSDSRDPGIDDEDVQRSCPVLHEVTD